MRKEEKLLVKLELEVEEEEAPGRRLPMILLPNDFRNPLPEEEAVENVDGEGVVGFTELDFGFVDGPPPLR
jgi:hypothetical protein